MNSEKLRKFIEDSFKEAKIDSEEDISRKKLSKLTDQGKINSIRSKKWVKKIAANLKPFLKNCDEGDIRIFSRESEHNEQNKFYFNRCEFLYDILACCVGKTGSFRSFINERYGGEKLEFVKEVLWQIESEVARSSKEAIIDFSKLIIGSAKNKLFVGSQRGNSGSNDIFMNNVLLPAAIACGNACIGKLYVALIPHPNDWDEKNQINVYELVDTQKWNPII